MACGLHIRRGPVLVTWLLCQQRSRAGKNMAQLRTKMGSASCAALRGWTAGCRNRRYGRRSCCTALWASAQKATPLRPDVSMLMGLQCIAPSTLIMALVKGRHAASLAAPQLPAHAPRGGRQHCTRAGAAHGGQVCLSFQGQRDRQHEQRKSGVGHAGLGIRAPGGHAGRRLRRADRREVAQELLR